MGGGDDGGDHVGGDRCRRSVRVDGAARRRAPHGVPRCCARSFGLRLCLCPPARARPAIHFRHRQGELSGGFRERRGAGVIRGDDVYRKREAVSRAGADRLQPGDRGGGSRSHRQRDQRFHPPRGPRSRPWARHHGGDHDHEHLRSQPACRSPPRAGRRSDIGPRHCRPASCQIFRGQLDGSRDGNRRRDPGGAVVVGADAERPAGSCWIGRPWRTCSRRSARPLARYRSNWSISTSGRSDPAIGRRSSLSGPPSDLEVEDIKRLVPEHLGIAHLTVELHRSKGTLRRAGLRRGLDVSQLHLLGERRFWPLVLDPVSGRIQRQPLQERAGDPRGLPFDDLARTRLGDHRRGLCRDLHLSVLSLFRHRRAARGPFPQVAADAVGQDLGDRRHGAGGGRLRHRTTWVCC